MFVLLHGELFKFLMQLVLIEEYTTNYNQMTF